MNMYFMYVVQYMKVCLKKNAINSSTNTLQIQHFKRINHVPNILIMLRKFYWVPFYYHIALIFLGLYREQEGAIFFQLRLSMLETLYTYLSINIQP